ncbi:MAG: FAD-dependent thymidylate synthase [Candidatus Paceibacterota bacterium]|jgi:thymidylate synthase ThyX
MPNKNLDELKHYETQIQGGGIVIVLDTGSVIGPESSAMLQALHSRSTGGLKSHLKMLSEKGSDNFMKNFYVGYGHKSIGDCGSTSIFIEGISMLAAKAIQDWPLYSGQESSTRYVDFKTQPFKNPFQTKEGEEILESWRSFYIEMLEIMKVDLKKQFPINEGEPVNIYDKAINARAFDILRGFLPAGSTTNIAWHTNLRQAADKLMLLRHHPLLEVRNVAEAIHQTLVASFPNSFGHKFYDETENYNDFWMKNDYYYHDKNCPDFKVVNNSINTKLLSKEVLEKRPPKTEVPKHVAEAGTLQLEFILDFGSFRDLQRHRAVTQRMPLITTEIGFEKWYINELPKEHRAKAESFIKEQEEKISKLNISKEEKQYYLAMGYNTSNRLTGNIPALVYLAELRATRFVHPTLRRKAKMLAETLSELFGKFGLVMHLDSEIDRFDIKRGEHDIVMK